eukprot:4283395-Amphidinium_carterae.1
MGKLKATCHIYHTNTMATSYVTVSTFGLQGTGSAGFVSQAHVSSSICLLVEAPPPRHGPSRHA